MIRRLINIVTFISLLLCVGAFSLWVRSYWRFDGWNWGTPTGRAGIDSFQGYLSFGAVRVPPAALARIPRGHLLTSEPAALGAARMLRPNWSFGVFRGARVNSGGMTAWDVRVPHWLVALVCAVAPAIHLYRKKRRAPPGSCRTCGYDLRASPERCPECGTLV